jgi:hypothetical protein
VKNWVQKQTRASIKNLTKILGPLGVILNLKKKKIGTGTQGSLEK